MKRSMTWIVLLCALNLAACATSANNCAGWQQISLKPDTAVYVAGNDTKAGADIADHKVEASASEINKWRERGVGAMMLISLAGASIGGLFATVGRKLWAAFFE